MQSTSAPLPQRLFRSTGRQPHYYRAVAFLCHLRQPVEVKFVGCNAGREAQEPRTAKTTRKSVTETSELVLVSSPRASSLPLRFCCRPLLFSVRRPDTPGRTGPPGRGSWHAPRRRRRCWPGGGRPGSWRAARSPRCTSRTWRSPTSRRRCDNDVRLCTRSKVVWRGRVCLWNSIALKLTLQLMVVPSRSEAEG